VVACDLSDAELKDVHAIFAAMAEAGEMPPGRCTTAVNADACVLPFADASFDRAIASEVLEHIPADMHALAELARILRPGGVLAVTVPAWLSETGCWLLSDEYHAPHVPGGHVRIYREWELRSKLRAVGLRPGHAHHAHGLHTPYWWLRCAVGPANETNPLVQAYKKVLEWDIIKAPPITKLADRLMSPLLGKSLVVYSRKPDPRRPELATAGLRHGDSV
jgi:SAM-dependent methyltransferase